MEFDGEGGAGGEFVELGVCFCGCIYSASSIITDGDL